MNKPSTPATLDKWFDYTDVISRREKQLNLQKELEKEFDKVFGDMYDKLGLNFHKL